MSSKRHGVGGLNIGKAVAMQQQHLAKVDQRGNNKITDVEEEKQPPANRGGGMGLALGGINQQPAAAQLSLNIGNKPAIAIERPPEIKRGQQLQDQTAEREKFEVMAGRRDNADEAQEKLDEDFDYKGTSRKQYENAMYNKVCSEILEKFLYLGSDIVAQDYAKLKENGITHVINCAADYSDDYHKEKGIKYCSFHLKDHVRENIECVFYEVINFMSEAKKQGGRVYVHCV